MVTTKYTFINFFPKNLILQFTKAANMYFLVIMFMQMIPAISISGGKPAQGMPLAFVVILSMIKDAYEDYKKSINDKTENIENKVKCSKSF